jgi:hypothetical protein
MKINKWVAISFCLLLIVSCFLPWTYHADLGKSFTGFFSERNIYGKPGKFLVFIAVCSILLILIPKIWAKRTHIFLAAFAVGYAIKTYILFTSCYNAYCPEKQVGIFLMMASCILILLSSVLPDVKLEESVRA